jgi:hypothetical protein
MPRLLFGEAFLFVSFAYLITRAGKTSTGPLLFMSLLFLLLFKVVNKKTVEAGRNKCQENNTSKYEWTVINFNHSRFSQN